MSIPETFTMSREHLLEYMLDEMRVLLAKQKRATAEALMAEANALDQFHGRAFKSTVDRLNTFYSKNGQYEIVRAVDPATGFGVRVRVVPQDAAPAVPSNGSAPLPSQPDQLAAEAAEEKLGADIAAGA